MSASTPSLPRIIARGEFKGLTARSVLQALSISRQSTSIHFHGRNGAPVGRAYVKAGMLLGAELTDGSLSGIEALRHMLRQPLKGYTVTRVSGRMTGQPMARLTSEILDVEPESKPIDKANGASVVELPPSTTAAAPARPGGPSRRPPSAGAPRPSSRGTEPQAAARPVARATALPVRAGGLARATSTSPADGPTTRPTAKPIEPSSVGLSSSSPPPLPPIETRVGAPPSSRERSTWAASTLAAAVPRAPQRGPSVPVIGVASPKGGAGKTTIALNLAVSFARKRFRVTVVDTDPNSDVLSALAARGKAEAGLYEYLAGDAELASLRLQTMIPELTIIPSHGPKFPTALTSSFPHRDLFFELFALLAADTDIIVVDTAAGMLGHTQEVLCACTHIVGVLQAEAIARRSFESFVHIAEATPSFPDVVGVVVNMVRPDHDSSKNTEREAKANLPAGWLFKNTIPYAAALAECAERGLPVAVQGDSGSAAAGSCFDAFAAECLDRLGVRGPPPTPRSFIL